MKGLEWSQDFPHYNPMGAICCHGNQSSDRILPKTLCSQSPTSMMLLMKFDYDWPAGFRDIHVWKCERTHGRTDARTDTGSSPIVEFKDFSRLLSDFPVLFKADLIVEDFLGKPSKFKYFSSLCEPWHPEHLFWKEIPKIISKVLGPYIIYDSLPLIQTTDNWK